MDPLGCRLFKEKECVRTTRSVNSKEIQPPVPGYPALATNNMAKIWNSVPELQNASTIGAAKTISKKWARVIPR